MPDRAKNFFFTSLVHQTRALQILVVRTQNPLVQRKKKRRQNRLVVADEGVMTKTTGWWTVNTQKKAANLVTNRRIFDWRDSKSEICFEDFKTSGTFLFLHFTFLIHALNVVKTWRLILQVVEKGMEGWERGMFSANRTKHLILDLLKFNPGKFFIPCLLKSTDKRLFVHLFFSVFVELFSSFVWDCLLFLSLRSIFQRLNRLIVF